MTINQPKDMRNDHKWTSCPAKSWKSQIKHGHMATKHELKKIKTGWWTRLMDGSHVKIQCEMLRICLRTVWRHRTSIKLTAQIWWHQNNEWRDLTLWEKQKWGGEIVPQRNKAHVREALFLQMLCFFFFFHSRSVELSWWFFYR